MFNYTAAKFNCPGTKNGLYSDPHNCGYFYQCSNGIPYHMPCPSGLQFNPDTRECDYPFIVNCGVPGGVVVSSVTAITTPSIPSVTSECNIERRLINIVSYDFS